MRPIGGIKKAAIKDPFFASSTVLAEKIACKYV
jgi:hypothetical protein